MLIIETRQDEVIAPNPHKSQLEPKGEKPPFPGIFCAQSRSLYKGLCSYPGACLAAGQSFLPIPSQIIAPLKNIKDTRQALRCWGPLAGAEHGTRAEQDVVLVPQRETITGMVSSRNCEPVCPLFSHDDASLCPACQTGRLVS